MDLEVNKHRVKVHYDKSIHLRRFNEGDLVLLWDQAKELLGAGKFRSMWLGPIQAWKITDNNSKGFSLVNVPN